MAKSQDSILHIETRGFKELTASFKDAPRKIQNIGHEWLKDVAEAEAEVIKQESPSQRIANAIQAFTRGWTAGVNVGPVDPPELTTWILKGTKPHVIAAVNAKALHFYWERRRHWYFFKSVNHPGTRPNDFIKRGAKKFDKQVRGWMKELNKRIVGALKSK